jgi:hypothetical protein
VPGYNLRLNVQQPAGNSGQKIMIIGGKATGKTYFIQNEIIPNLTNYVVVDWHDEYGDDPNTLRFDQNLSQKEKYQVLIGMILHDKYLRQHQPTYIIDDALMLDKHLLAQVLRGLHSVVVVFQSIHSILHFEGPIYDFYDRIYLGHTLDAPDQRMKFVLTNQDRLLPLPERIS